MGNNQSTLSEEDIQEINHLASREPSSIRNNLENKCYGWKNTEVQIGIIGESHRGKSSFINASRGLKPTDTGAAKVKNKECTKEPKIYEYPNNSKIKLVDLPGANTINFPIETYLDEMNYSRYVGREVTLIISFYYFIYGRYVHIRYYAYFTSS